MVSNEQGAITEKKRNSSIEVMRLFAMVCIVFSHFSIHTSFPDRPSGLFFNDIVLSMGIIGDLGTDIFVLISGYFLYGRKTRISSLARLYLQVWFYSVLGLGIYIVTGHIVTAKIVVSSLLPVSCISYWFFSTYVAFIFLAPFLNNFLETLNRDQFRALIALNVILFSVVPFCIMQAPMFDHYLSSFFILYIIGAYFRKYGETKFRSPRLRLACIFGPVLLVSVFAVLFNLDGGRSLRRFQMRLSLPTLLLAVGLFTTAIYSRPFYSKLLNRISSCTFAVYLFHEALGVRDIIWNELFRGFRFYDSPYLLPYGCICVFLIFLCGILLELVRQKLPDRWIVSRLTALFSRLDLAPKVF